MRKRLFYIPIIIFFVLATISFGLTFIFSLSMMNVFDSSSELGEALGAIFGALGMVYFWLVTMVISLPVVILSIIFIVKARKREVSFLPAVILLGLTLIYNFYPIVAILIQNVTH